MNRPLTVRAHALGASWDISFLAQVGRKAPLWQSEPINSAYPQSDSDENGTPLSERLFLFL
jgi:hypothetical protein